MQRFLIFLAAFMVMAQCAKADELATRFGPLRIQGAMGENVLTFGGRELVPSVTGNTSLEFVKKFEIGDADVTLILDNGGSACPSLFYFVTTDRDGATSIGLFGSCAYLKTIKRSGDVISLIMPGFAGADAQPEAAVRKADKERHVFTFANGRLTENGHPAKTFPN